MALPTSGIITAAMINQELGRAAGAAFSLNDPAVRALAQKPSGAISFADLRGKSSEIVVTATHNNSHKVCDYFTAADWASATNKRFIIPSGFESIWRYVYAVDTPAWGGHLTIQVDGIMSGRGGARNSDPGGYGFYADMGSTANLSLINNGIIRGGGGGGGRGGTGGPGQYGSSVREPASGHAWQKSVYEYTSREIRDTPSKSNPNPPRTGWRYWIVWAGTYLMNGGVINDPVFRPSMVFGGITYTIETSSKQGQDAGVFRTYTSTTHTTGGAGGQGGVGQGFGQARGEGTAGSAGGQGAGSGGWGNWGGFYGTAGSTGATGNAGNNGAGGAGAAGGAAGPSIQGRNRLNYSGSGQLIGATINT